MDAVLAHHRLDGLAGERGQDVYAINCAVARLRNPRDFQHGGEDVCADHRDVAGCSRFDIAWPGNDAGNSDSAFVIAPLSTTQVACRAAEIGNRAIVGCEYQQRVVSPLLYREPASLARAHDRVA